MDGEQEQTLKPSAPTRSSAPPKSLSELLAIRESHEKRGEIEPKRSHCRFKETNEAKHTAEDGVPHLMVRSQLGKDDFDALVEALGDQLEDLGFDELEEVFYNASVAELVEQAVLHEEGAQLTDRGALAVVTKRSGRSARDWRVVEEPDSIRNVWWASTVANRGSVLMREDVFDINRQRALDFLNSRRRLYVVDGFAGWDSEYRIPVRVLTSLASHALVATHLLVAPTDEELVEFEVNAYPRPFTVFDAGKFPCDRYSEGITSSTCVAVALSRGEMVVLGTDYSGEIKEGILTAMMYHMPGRPEPYYSAANRALPLHGACSVDVQGRVTVFVGRPGSGKTMLSSDSGKQLLNDNAVLWTSEGIRGIASGCHTKITKLDSNEVPYVCGASRFGSVIENISQDDYTRKMDMLDTEQIENSRCIYPLRNVPKAILPSSLDQHPSSIIFLVCDTFGVFPPVAHLTPEQALYHFISGYGGLCSGLESLVPVPSFAACFTSACVPREPDVYAELFSAKVKAHCSQCWLVNTGWIGGAVGMGRRISRTEIRTLVNAICDGLLDALPSSSWETTAVFNLSVPSVEVDGIPPGVLKPDAAWEAAHRGHEYLPQISALAGHFQANFAGFRGTWTRIAAAGAPQLPASAA